MKIVNLTQHPASPEQEAAGVYNLEGDELARLKALLTFDSLPSSEEVNGRAIHISLLAEGDDEADEPPEAAMIGGAPYLMAPLERHLRQSGIAPLYAFSLREAVEERLPDGGTKKTQVFRHAGFVPAT